MCGRFAQYSCRDGYFEAAGILPEELPFDSAPWGGTTLRQERA